jgi:hypothetical protein
MPPPALILFLGEVVLSVSKSEHSKGAIKKPVKPTPTVSRWNAPPVCPAPRGAADDLVLDEQATGDQAGTGMQEANPPTEQPKPRSRSPRRQSAPPAAAPSAAGAADGRIDALQNQVASLVQQMNTMQELLQRLVATNSPQ